MSARRAVVQAAPAAPPVQPNLLDKVVSWVSPERGMARLEARAALTSGAYAAGRSDRTATRSWHPSRGSANAEVEGDRPLATGRARSLGRDNPIAASALLTTVAYTVGTGLWPVPQIDAELLGLTDEEADDLAVTMDRLWFAWATTLNSDVARRQTFAQHQALAIRSERENGDVFVVRRWKERPGMLFGTCLQLIEADRVATPPEHEHRKDVVGGIEFDADGEPIACYIRNEHPGEEPGITTATPAAFTRVPFYVEGEWHVLHLVDMLRPEQIRGMTFFAPVVEALRSIGEFSDAELDAAVISAFHTVVVTNTTPPEDDEEGGLGTGGALTDETPIITHTGPAGVAEAPVGPALKLGKGNVFELEDGQGVEVVESKRPNPAFAPFFEAMTTYISAALGLPPEVVAAKFTTSYTAARGALLHLWRIVNLRRYTFGESYLDPVRAAVVDEAVARGYLAVRPDYWTNPLVRLAYLGCRWIGDPPGQIDPLKETKAAELKVARGFSTYEEETLLMNGGDFRRNVRRLRREVAELREAGVLAAPPDQVSAEAQAIIDAEKEDAGGKD